MPANIKIQGDDPVWKRKVDEVLLAQADQIRILLLKIKYLESRSK